MSKHTVEEVIEVMNQYSECWCIPEVDGPIPEGSRKIIDMLHAYAERIKADEEVVPRGWIISWDTEDGRTYIPVRDEPNMAFYPSNATKEPLFTHPSAQPAKPEDAVQVAKRLAALEQAMGEVDGRWFTNQKDLLIWLKHRADEIMRGVE